MKWVVIILGKGNYYQHHETTEKRNGVKFGRCAEHGMRKGDGGGYADVELKASLAPDDQATRTHPPLSERQKKGVARLLLWRMICTVTLYHRTIWIKTLIQLIHWSDLLIILGIIILAAVQNKREWLSLRAHVTITVFLRLLRCC